MKMIVLGTLASFAIAAVAWVVLDTIPYSSADRGAVGGSVRLDGTD